MTLLPLDIFLLVTISEPISAHLPRSVSPLVPAARLDRLSTTTDSTGPAGPVLEGAGTA
jgi:hypothetical protein